MMKKILGKSDPQLFWFGLVSSIVLALIGAIYPKEFASVLSSLMGGITKNFGWFFLGSVAACLIFLLFISLGRYGNVKLGKDDETPEFSLFSWISMLFSCGIAVGFIFWGVAEPLYHYMQTPYIAKGGTPEAVPVALQITLLHYGLHGWAIYAVVGLAIAFSAFRLGRPLTVANALYGLMGDRVDGIWGKVIDFLASVATIAGVSTSLGMALLSIKYGINHLFGLELSTTGLIVVLLLLIVAYTISAVSGLARGIRYLSNINMCLMIGVLLFIWVAGPTLFTTNLIFESVGAYLQNFIFMTFWTDSANQSGWLGWWTVFYWAWWIAWAPFVGGFVARISRGRTIKEFVWGVMVLPTLIGVIWFNVVGGSTIYAEMTGALPMWEAVQADVGSGIYVLLSGFPFGKIVSYVVFFNLIVFVITSADSAAFFVGMIMSRGELEPTTMMKLIWGFIIGGIAMLLLATGGLKGLQTASVVAALPFSFIMVGMMFSINKMLAMDGSSTTYRADQEDEFIDSVSVQA